VEVPWRLGVATMDKTAFQQKAKRIEEDFFWF